MNIRIRAMSQNERLYTYPQSQRLQEETENIGYLIWNQNFIPNGMIAANGIRVKNLKRN